jgi:hypothetical protein
VVRRPARRSALVSTRPAARAPSACPMNSASVRGRSAASSPLVARRVRLARSLSASRHSRWRQMPRCSLTCGLKHPQRGPQQRGHVRPRRLRATAVTGRGRPRGRPAEPEQPAWTLLRATAARRTDGQCPARPGRSAARDAVPELQHDALRALLADAGTWSAPDVADGHRPAQRRRGGAPRASPGPAAGRRRWRSAAARTTVRSSSSANP